MKNVFPFLHAFAVLLLLGTTAIAATRYVQPTAAGSGDGSSWANASASLQAMIDASAAGDAVWVAAGTYKPAAHPTGCTDCGSTRDYSFRLKDGVSVYGGFAGTETALSQRNFTTNTTILSGDIGIANDISDNCFHVVIAAFVDVIPTSRLDGFTITHGNANINSSITVEGKSVSRQNGGGIITYGGTNTLANNIQTANAAINGGGAVSMESGTNTLTNSTLSANSAPGGGGGVFTNGGTNTLTNNTFSANSSNGGGAIYTYSGINTITNNTLSANSGTLGGGIYAVQGTNTVTSNTFSANSGNAGGGINFNGGTNTFTNNILSANVVTGSGGGVFSQGGTNALTNNTFVANSATYGGGVNTYGGTNTFKNNLFWNNNQAGIANISGADYYTSGSFANTFKNNLLQLESSDYPVANTGTYAIGAGATGNIFGTDPLFTDASDIDGSDNIHRTDDDGLRLQSTSPVIDKGTNTGAPATDILGTARTGTADIGAYEQKAPNAIFLPNATPFVLWPNPAHDQLCVTVPNTADAGLYDLNGRAIRSFMLVEGANTLNISELAAGVYMLRMGSAAVKVVKE